HRRSRDDRVVELELDRCMVASLHLRVDLRAAQERTRARRDEREIEAPADVARAHAVALAPPRVVASALLELAERDDEAAREPAMQLLALDRQEAARLRVLLRAREIDLVRCGVEVPHHDDRLAAIERGLELAEQSAIEAELVRHARVVVEVPAAVRKVAVGDR